MSNSSVLAGIPVWFDLSDLGMSADAKVFRPTVIFNYDCLAFCKSWLGTTRDEQQADGMIPNVIPVIPNIRTPWCMVAASPDWRDASVIIPGEVHVRKEDRSVLSENIELMKRHLACWRYQAVEGLIDDWRAFVDLLHPYDEEQPGDTPVALPAPVFYAKKCTDSSGHLQSNGTHV